MYVAGSVGLGRSFLSTPLLGADAFGRGPLGNRCRQELALWPWFTDTGPGHHWGLTRKGPLGARALSVAPVQRGSRGGCLPGPLPQFLWSGPLRGCCGSGDTSPGTELHLGSYRHQWLPRCPEPLSLHSHWPHSLWFGETPEAPAFGTHELRQSHEAPEWLESAGRSPQARGQNLLRGQESAVPASRSPVAPHPHPGLALPQRTRALRHARPDQTPGPALGLHRRLEVGRAQMCPGLEFPQKVMF